MQGRKFLFEPSNLNRQTPANLFEKSDFKPLKVSNVRTISLVQFKLFDRQQFDENSNVLATPPMEKKSVPTPQAPVKNKARSRKVDLKPKKLQYSEEELGAHSDPDSGVCVRLDQSSDSLLRKQHTVNCKKPDPPQKPTRILRTRLDKIKIQTDDKENDRNVVRNTSNARNNVAQTSVEFNPNAEELSQCDSDLDWKQRLRWLQARRDIGVWIECCNERCTKWRYTEDYHDPSDVPKLWYCDMNSDKSIASCTVPQYPIPSNIQIDLIESAYNAGSIVWAQVIGYPWWPGLICDSPHTVGYYELANNSLKPSKYHIVFIQEEKFEYAWVQKKNIKPFKSITYEKLIKKTKYRGVDYKSSLKSACELAANALKLSISDRLEKFSYLALYEKLYHRADNNDANNLIDTAYNAGSIVWARITGYPWWPGLICDSPDTFRYYKLANNSLKPSKYHIVFIQEEKFEYAWVQKKNIKPFKSITYEELIKKTKYRGVDYKSSLKSACELAANALKLSISDRLEKFSYLALYEKLYDRADNNDANNNNTNRIDVTVVQDVSAMDTSDTSDEIIPPSPTFLPNPNHISLKDFYYNVVLPHKQRQLDRCSATTNQC